MVSQDTHTHVHAHTHTHTHTHTGHLSDPDDIPGLAHLCEHMLFLGTEKVSSGYSIVSRYKCQLIFPASLYNTHTQYPSENEYTEVSVCNIYGMNLPIEYWA